MTTMLVLTIICMILASLNGGVAIYSALTERFALGGPRDL